MTKEQLSEQLHKAVDNLIERLTRSTGANPYFGECLEMNIRVAHEDHGQRAYNSKDEPLYQAHVTHTEELELRIR